MAGPRYVGCRNLWCWIGAAMMMMLLLVEAAPQHDRRTLTVGTGFGRSLFDTEEPTLITEPLPGQEFVFISATNPGARTARLFGGSDVQPAKIDDSGAPTVHDEDGILVLDRQEQSPAFVEPFARGGHQLSSPEEAPQPQPFQVHQTWHPVTLPKLLDGSVVLLHPNQPDEPSEGRSDEPSIVVLPPVPESFSAEDAVQGDQNVSQQPPVAAEEEDRQSKAIDAKVEEDHFNLIPAESVSSRTVIKTAANGQDYEYEYLYYDDGDDLNVASHNAALEPSLLVPDQRLEEEDETAKTSTVLAAAGPQEHQTGEQQEGDVAVEAHPVEDKQHSQEVSQEEQRQTDKHFVEEIPAEEPQQIPVVEQSSVEEQEDSSSDEKEQQEKVPEPVQASKTESEEVQEPVQVPKAESEEVVQAPKVESEEAVQVTNVESEEVVQVANVESDEIVVVTTTTEAATTTEGKRRRPVRPENEEPVTTRPRFRTTTTTEKVEKPSRTRRPRPQVNAVSSSETDSKGKESTGSRRRISNRKGSTTAAQDALSSRQGLAEERAKDSFDLDDFFDLSTDSPAVKASNEADDEVELSFAQRGPVNSRFPSRFHQSEEQDDQEDPIQQGRTPLRVVDSSSFRNSASGGSSGEQHTVGRLTVLSGPARLPPAPTSDEKDEDDAVPASQAPHIIQAQVITASEEDSSAHQQTEELEGPREDETEQQQQQQPHRTSPSSRPDLIDLLAFSRAVEQQQQDEQSTETSPTIEDVHIEEVHATPISKEAEGEALDGSVPTTKEEEAIADQAHVPVTTPEPEVPKVTPTETQEPSIGTEVILAESVESDAQEEKEVTAVTDEPEDDETFTTEAPTTPVPTTTTTAATTTTTTTTTTTSAPETSTTRGRGQNRFGASNRIRGRTRGGEGATTASSVADTPTSTSAPAVRRPVSNSFNNRGSGGSLSNRFRRPSTTAAPTDEASGDESASSTTAASAAFSRRPISPRNRFNIRRGEEASSTTAPSVSAETRAPPSPRPRPVQSANRVISARPSILTRGRTTTSTTTTSAPVEEAEDSATSTDVPSEGSEETEVKQTSSSTTSTTEATTTTTSRASGLNRLRNRISLAVSERPKPVRSQVSLNERRNRFTALNTKKTSSDEVETSKATSAEGGTSSNSTQATVSSPEEEQDHEGESSNISPVALRSLRHNLRRPGQLAAVNRRTPSS